MLCSMCSTTYSPCGPPNPRYAVFVTREVFAARPSQRKLGNVYGPLHWNSALFSTADVTSNVAPPSATSRTSAATIFPSELYPTLYL